MEDLKNIIESLLFVAEEPLTIDRLKKIITGAQSQELRGALEELSAGYETRQGGFYLNHVAGGYQIRTRPEYKEWIKHMLQPKPLRLSKAALETLAIIAYKQPVIRSDVEHIRGVDCGGVLRVLLERKFIRVLGRKEIPGRPLIYATTKRFLEVFDLKNLKDLPTPKEIEEFGSALAEEVDETDREEEAAEISSEDTEETGIISTPVESETYLFCGI
jgi:segregation and condensation protein B